MNVSEAQLYDLSVWAVESRYPGHTPDVTQFEARQTLQLAKAIFDAVSRELQERIQQKSE